MESNPKVVYLTDAYAPYFALCAAKDTSRPMVVQVDTERLEKWDLVPDEDVLEQIYRGKDGLRKDWDIIKRTLYYRERLDVWAGKPEISLHAMGTCGFHGTIPVNAITKIVAFDPKITKMFSWASLDPTITILNYQLCGSKYRGLTKWLFGLPLGKDKPKPVNADQAIIEKYGPQFDYVLPPEEERAGIEVLYERELEGA